LDGESPNAGAMNRVAVFQILKQTKGFRSSGGNSTTILE
jgi:hypothetical protein